MSAGHFNQVLLTEDLSPIDPDVSELKVYAPGIGQAVLAVDVSGGADREEFIAYSPEHPRNESGTGSVVVYR